MEKIRLRNTSILLKYLNCLERVLFIDNRWMKDYNDLINGINKNYIGVPLYLKKILESFQKYELDLFYNFKPKRDDIFQTVEEDCVILESLPVYAKGENEKSLTVVACPKIERVFHFRYSKEIDDYMLKKGKLKDFFSHPQLPRIKILSRNFEVYEEKSSLSELKFLYTLITDADKMSGSILVENLEPNFKDKVPDPALGVQVGSLASYYIAPLKLVNFKVYPENIHQIILIVEDWKRVKHEIYITTLLFRQIFNQIPNEEFFNRSRFVRGLIFQEFCESFKHALFLEEISEDEFKKDSILAYIRVRVNVDKKDIEEDINMPNEIFERNGTYSYFNPEFDLETYNSYNEYNKTKKLASINRLLDIRKMSYFFDFNPNLKKVYSEKQDLSKSFIEIGIKEHNVVGLHKYLLRKPIISLKFYTLNNEMYFFCISCKKFLERLKLKDIPNRCPICNSRKIVELIDVLDRDLFNKKEEYWVRRKKIEHYTKLASLSNKFGKYIYLTKIATSEKYKDCVPILNKIYRKDLNIDSFFDGIYNFNKESNRIEIAPFKIEEDEI